MASSTTTLRAMSSRHALTTRSLFATRLYSSRASRTCPSVLTVKNTAVSRSSHLPSFRPSVGSRTCLRRFTTAITKAAPQASDSTSTATSDWTPPQNWERRPVVVLGGGVLGRRIAACFVAAGHHVIIRDPSEKSRSAALDYIKENINVYTNIASRKAGTYEAEEDFETAVKDAWFVIEAVPEILSIKEETFEQLERLAPEDCILATNSSSYKSEDLISKVQKETTKRILNTHFMMPPEVCTFPYRWRSLPWSPKLTDAYTV